MIVEVSVATLLELGAPPEELDALGVRPSDAALRLDWTARGLVVAVRAPRLYQAAYDAGELPRVACIGRDPWDVLGGRGLSLAGVYLPAATFAGASAAVADFTDARLELALEEALERPRPEHRIVALVGQPLPRAFVKIKRDLPLRQLRGEVLDHRHGRLPGPLRLFAGDRGWFEVVGPLSEDRLEV